MGALPRRPRGRRTDRLMVAVEHVGIEVVAVGPYNGAELGVEADLAKVCGVSQGLGHRAPEVT